MSSLISKEKNVKVTENLDSVALPNSYKAAIRLVTKVALQTASITDEAFQELADESFNEEEI